MGNIKRKKIIILIIVIVILFCALYAYRILNLNIKEGVTLSLEPEFLSKNMVYQDSSSIIINSRINNYWLCKAECSHKFTDLSQGVIFEENFTVKNRKTISYDAKISADIKGYGQKIYQYEIECSNIKTKTCPSGDENYRRKASIIIDYGPNNNQLAMINNSKNIFLSMAQNMAFSEIDILNASNIISSVDVNFQDKQVLDSLWQKSKELKESAKDVIKLWKNDEFELAKITLDNISEDAKILKNSSKEYFDKLILAVDTNNLLVSKQKEIINRTLVAQEFVNYYPYEYNDSYSRLMILREDIQTLSALININTLMINSKEGYAKTLYEQEYTLAALQKIEMEMHNISDMSRDQYVDVYIAQRMSCNNENCGEGGYINSSSSNASLPLEKCAIAIPIISKFEKLRAENLKRREELIENNNLNISLEEVDIQERYELINILKNASEIKNYTKIYRYISEINNSTIISEPYIINPALKEYYALSFNPFLSNLIELKYSCTRQKENFTFNNVTKDIVSIPELNVRADIMNLPAIEEKCCIENYCDCCKECKNYPVILLHGHSFVQKNSAYSSTEVFNSLEDTLVRDGYVSLGTISLFDSGIIKSSRRAVIKPTYYVELEKYIEDIEFIVKDSKGENITTYASRLNEKIIEAKQITGQDKVVILAHSMGGLVARKYVQMYGKDSVDKLILVGTPNNGIDSTTHTLCKIFGEEKECDDMLEGSFFLKGLEEFQDYPETYLIVGVGCDTAGADGDGVIRKDSVLMPGFKTYFINGTCTTTGKLHGKMLDIDEYPQTYRIIEKIIS